MQADREQTLGLIRRAEASAYQALVVTVDAPLAGIRNKEQRAGFQLPPTVRAVNLDGRPLPQHAPAEEGQSVVFDVLMAGAPTWSDLEWLASATRLPVLVKGILDAEDAMRALNCGAAGIMVSNHGGRIQDTVPATIDALPSIAQAVGKRAPVLVDGGIRRGSDIFKAIALGASAVLIGRPYIHALAAAGALGVAHALRTLREELEIVMALNGCPTLDAIDRDALFAGKSVA
jgi:4-hydroxymandelate oxidase